MSERGSTQVLRAGPTAGLALAVWSCCAPASAHAAPAIPEGCGSAAEFQSELRRRVDPATAIDSVQVTLTPELAGYRLVVEAAGERRELHDQNCEELLRAALVISVALLEPNARAEPAPAAEASAPMAPVRMAPAQPRSRPRFALGAGTGAHFGTTPQTTLLLDLDAQLRWSRWGLAGGFRYLLPTSLEDEAKHGARVGGLGGYLAGVIEPSSRFQGRLGVVVYRLSGAGLGAVAQAEDGAWEAGPTLAASFTPFARPPFWTSIGGEGQLNLLRARFEIRDYGTVFRVPWLSGSVFARAGVVW